MTLTRPGSRAAMGSGLGATAANRSRGHTATAASAVVGGFGVNNGSRSSSNGERLVGEGSGSQATAAAAATTPEAGSENKRGNTANGGGSGALFYHRSPAGAAGASAGGGGGGGGTATALGGNKPLLLPKPTMAAHNGRLLMEYEWGFARF